MTYALKPLPYTLDALEPYISKRTLEFHYHKHHQGYVDKLNELIVAHPRANMSLEELIMCSSGALFHSAAQVWNHDFFWQSLAPATGQAPKGKITELIEKKWQTFQNFKAAFSEQALNHFGSGWTWLVLRNGQLEIVSTSNAHNPIVLHTKAVLTLDVWEHAYYLDFQNNRAQFIDAFWNIVNWDAVNDRLGA